MIIKKENFFPSFLNYIEKSLNKTNLKKYLILGNVTCDLDSFISTFLLSIAKNFSFIPRNRLYIPILNCERGDLKYRFDIDYLTKLYKLNKQNMFYINDPNIKNLLKKNDNKIILVDHNKLDIEQKELIKNQNNKIVSIYDHHKDSDNKNNPNVIKHIYYPLGSCSTLILNKFFLGNPFLFNYINPLLSISAILMDTENFNKKLFNKKWNQLDKFVFNEILYENKIKPPYFKRDLLINKYNKKIKKEKNDISKNYRLGLNGILKKDLKNFIWKSGIKAKWSTIQISFNDLLNKFGYKNLINEMNKVCKSKHYDLYIINTSVKYKGSSAKKFMIYNYAMAKNKFNNFINNLSQELQKNKFCYEINRDKDKENVVYFIVDPFLSRKHFLL